MKLSEVCENTLVKEKEESNDVGENVNGEISTKKYILKSETVIDEPKVEEKDSDANGDSAADAVRHTIGDSNSNSNSKDECESAGCEVKKNENACEQGITTVEENTNCNVADLEDKETGKIEETSDKCEAKVEMAGSCSEEGIVPDSVEEEKEKEEEEVVVEVEKKKTEDVKSDVVVSDRESRKPNLMVNELANTNNNDNNNEYNREVKKEQETKNEISLGPMQLLNKECEVISDVNIIDLEDDMSSENAGGCTNDEKAIFSENSNEEKNENATSENMVVGENEEQEEEKDAKGTVSDEASSSENTRCEIEVEENCQPGSEAVAFSAESETEREKPTETSSTSFKRDSDILSRPMPKSRKLSLLQDQALKRQEHAVPEVNMTEEKVSSDAEMVELQMQDADHSNSELSRDSKGQEDSSSIETNSSGSTDIGECNRRKRKKNRIDWLKFKEESENSVSEGTRAKRKKIRVTTEIDTEWKEVEKDGGSPGPCDRSDSQQAPSMSTRVSESNAFEKSNRASINGRRLSAGSHSLRTESSSHEKAKSTFLASLRGTLKSLTRSDLEELIVQKLCEVITERSSVGKLRRRAQALEEDQERWRAKVSSLTKQVKEMEMVMKKYMAEVQKQAKDKGGQIVVPLRVTRSVGLQVSFYSSSNKGQKSISQVAHSGNSTTAAAAAAAGTVTAVVASASLSPASTTVHTLSTPSIQIGQSLTSNSKFTKQPPPKIPPLLSVQPKNKSYAITQKNPSQQNTKKQSTTRPEHGNAVHAARHSLLPPPVKSNTVQSTRQRQESYKHVLQNQKQQQNGSKVIDLTDDDDKQSPVAVKSPVPVRINNFSQSQITVNNRYAYILPNPSASASVTSTPTSTGAQNVQVLVAGPVTSQPNRQLMPMPPLLFKGGNAGQPTSQPSNQPNSTIAQKSLKHPAPLPKQPVVQFHNSNLKLLPPRPALKISKVQTGIVLSWNMSLGPEHAPISSYQLYAYQEGTAPPATSLWKKVGDVKALPLPMACTLTQFMSGHKYHFAVRAVDYHSRIGPFSYPGTIVLVK